jgi:hypothetical protein
VKFLLLYDIKIYVNNLLVQIDTSAISSYTPAYTNIAIYFISSAYCTTPMPTHTSFLIHFRWSTIMSILSLSTTTSGIAWTAVGGEGIDDIYSIMSSHWKNWQPLAWNTRLTTHSLALNRETKLKYQCIWKDAYPKVGAHVEHTVKVPLCGCSIPVGEDMATRSIHPLCVWDSHCSFVWALRHVY